MYQMEKGSTVIKWNLSKFKNYFFLNTESNRI